ncbi:MAG: hypothetical protein K5863_05635 [Nitratireductor sp.]|uniref:hypothetical protein n=1 Tax=Nitratireductor sp. TaxID=1872084 RepID=UPI002625D5EE|nr:hypothetical protein [Nitratireductor sp.]MCV0349537.1 hypothetical protein [Nitratireductor sp.]
MLFGPGAQFNAKQAGMKIDQAIIWGILGEKAAAILKQIAALGQEFRSGKALRHLL